MGSPNRIHPPIAEWGSAIGQWGGGHWAIARIGVWGVYRETVSGYHFPCEDPEPLLPHISRSFAKTAVKSLEITGDCPVIQGIHR